MPNTTLSIFVLTHNVSDQDTLHSAIVCAKSGEEARNIHPLEEIFLDPEVDYWKLFGNKGTKYWGSSPSSVKARLLGVAAPGIDIGLVYRDG